MDVTKYLNKCKKNWDKKPRLTLAGTAYGLDADGMRMLTAFMRGAVDRALNPGATIPLPVLTIDHIDDAGRALCKALFGGGYVETPILLGRRKSDEAVCAEAWCMDLSQSITRHTKIGTLSTFVQKTTDRRNVFVIQSRKDLGFPKLKLGLIETKALAKDRDMLWGEIMASVAVEPPAPPAPEPVKPAEPPIDLVIAFDTTGSMAGAINEVKRRAAEFAGTAFDTVPNLRIAVVSHGDYADKANCINMNPFSTKREDITRQVEQAPRTNGGDSPECYELVLHKIADMPWRKEAQRVVLYFGDASPHTKDAAAQQIRQYGLDFPACDWTEEAKRIGGKIIAVECIGANGGFWKQLPALTGGVYLNLTGWNETVQTILMALYSQVSVEKVQTYTEDLRKSGLLTRGLETMSTTLTKATASRGGLKGVGAGEFIVMDVLEKIAIEKFVEKHGISFSIGDGFYELDKKEKVIQAHKQIVVQNKAKPEEFYTGVKARQIVGLPEKTDAANVKPYVGPWRVFVQSTSMNRLLMAGTKFLYRNPAFIPA